MKEKLIVMSLCVVALSPLVVGCASTCKAKSARNYPSENEGMVMVTQHSAAPASSARSEAAPVAAGDVLELKEEKVAVQKQVNGAGTVVVRKIVTEKDVVVPVTIERTEYLIERTPVSGDPTTPFAEGQIHLDLTKESASAVVTPHVYERVRLVPVKVQESVNLPAKLRTEVLVSTNITGKAQP